MVEVVGRETHLADRVIVTSDTSIRRVFRTFSITGLLICKSRENTVSTQMGGQRE